MMEDIIRDFERMKRTIDLERQKKNRGEAAEAHLLAEAKRGYQAASETVKSSIESIPQGDHKLDELENGIVEHVKTLKKIFEEEGIDY